MISGIIYMIGVIVMDFFYPALYGICGIIIGSFLNVCILRIPEGQSFVTGRSHCPACKRQLYPLDMVPILSFLFLGGKCRFCGKTISIQYPLVEAGTALLFFLCCLAKGSGAAAAIMCLFGSLLTVGAWIDARHMYIPDGISLSILILAAASLMTLPRPDILSRMAGAVMCGGFLAVLRMLTKGGIGLGDVKLMASSGLLLGVKAGMAALLAAYVLAGLWCLIPLIRGRVNGRTRIPMVPFFAISLIAFGLWYREIMTWYMGLFLP